MALSGFAGLTYQVVWTRHLGIWLGHEIVAVLAVVAAFFGGLAAGAALLGPRIERSAHPIRWYVALELAIAAWALVLDGGLSPASAWIAERIGAEPTLLRHWGLAFGGPFLLLLPATAAMGATLPAMQRVLGAAQERGYGLGGLYAANTAGGCIGVVLAAFWMLPGFGLSASARIAAAANVACALLVMLAPLHATASATASASTAMRKRGATPLLILAATGFLGIGYEVAIIRTLGRIGENTVYTYAITLAVYLAVTAAGAAAYQHSLRQPRRIRGDHLRGALLFALCLVSVVSVLLLGLAERLGPAVQGLLGASPATALATESLAALLGFALPAAGMGALFSHLCVQARERGWSFGAALAANTLGSALAPPVVGVMLIPATGVAPVLLLLAVGYLALLPLAWWRARTAFGAAATAMATAALMVSGPSLRFAQPLDGARLLSHREGTMASVSVLEQPDGTRTLHIDNRVQEGSSRTRFMDERLAWLPMLLHSDPRRALFLGLGTGVTSASAAADSRANVDVVELLPEVIEASALFVPKANPNLRLLAGDARRFVRASGHEYDLVVADLFHPARDGSAALFTVEHFRAVRARLADEGIFCQWLPLHQMDLDTLRSIVAAYLEVFPDAAALLAANSLDTPVVGLVARAGGMRLQRAALERRIADAAPAGAPARLRLDDTLAVAGSFFADADALRRFAGEAPANRDDLPIVAYLAPRSLHAPRSDARERLLGLLAATSARPESLSGIAADADEANWQTRLAAYWRARDRYIQVGAHARPGTDAHSMLAAVQDGLLSVLGLSPDFLPAYEPLLSMAVAVASSDPMRSRELLQRLTQLRPDRNDAQAALARLTRQRAPFARPSFNDSSRPALPPTP